MKKVLLAVLGILTLNPATAQDTTEAPGRFSVTGYVEAYYNYDFNRPATNTLPGFVYNFNRANEVNLNLAFIKGSYNSERVRAGLALAAGTYMNANYAAEPGVLKNLFEASVGVKISAKHNLWVDAGIMPSHIGFESAVGKDNRTLTRSLVAENSPYFESGVKLGYTSNNGKWYLAALYLNGWQRIQRPDGNTTPAVGTQVTFKPSSAVTLNYSTFIGNDKPDSAKRMRYYHNVYGLVEFTRTFGITAGFDVGTEQKPKGGKGYHTWFVPVVIARFTPSKTIRFAARGEYFSDANGVIIGSGAPGGFKTFGYSFNVDYLPFENMMWRLEARSFNSKDPIFTRRDGVSHRNYFVATSLALSF